jgi:ribosomal peptide maturation radical SAM protein 1
VKKDNRPVVLISAPWPLFNRPSIQLGTLKAWLRHRLPRQSVVTQHVYLDIAAAVGYGRYAEIAKRTWVAETVYAGLLYPERMDRIVTVQRRESRQLKRLSASALAEAAAAARTVSDDFVHSLDWTQCKLIGFTICLCQLTASLYFIRRIRELAPGVPLVVGGSTITAPTAQGLLAAFPEIDYAVVGEGEVPLERLVRSLGDGAQAGAIAAIPGLVVSVKNAAAPEGPRFSQVADLNGLPPPEYDDYFRRLSSLRPERRFFPTLPVELSRGCSWQARQGARGGCAFCNLNQQWAGYRWKKPRRAASEIDRLTDRHRLLAVALMDNSLPPGKTRRICRNLEALGKDLWLFGEVRASTPYPVLEAMRAAGFAEIQVGIEALSRRLLRRLNKGTSVLQNIEIMRACEELGIRSDSNLICGFPGSTPREVDETLQALEFVYAYRPLRLVNFWLGLGSPVWRRRREFGIRAVFNHPHYRHLFPSGIGHRVPFTIQAYRGDVQAQRRLWRPVRAAVSRWQQDYARLQQGVDSSPILSYRDGGRFLIIRQRRPGDDPLIHRLSGVSRDIYMYCRRSRSRRRILNRFPRSGSETIARFLTTMQVKKLMYAENDRFLSLAVAVRPTPRRGP